jgi:predicted DNA binding protein
MGASMSLWEISFRARWDYPFINLSRENPGAVISMWCVWNRELLQVATEDLRVLDSVEKGLRKAGRIVDEHRDSARGRVFLIRCTCDKYTSIWNIAAAHQLFEAPPFVFRDGWGYFRLLAFEEAASRDLFRDLNERGEAELLRKRELPLSVLPTTMWVHGLFGDLTGKQIDALLKAQHAGYYTSPRGVTTEDVARGVGVSRSTYEEHLRKAENRIVSALVPYLEIYVSADRPADRLPLRGPLVESGNGAVPA